MAPYLLLIPILLPVACGAFSLFYRGWGERQRNYFTFAVSCVTSVLVLLLLLRVRRTAVTVYQFTPSFAISFRVDGMGTLFAGILAFMWPLALLYAYEYIHRSSGHRQFFSFYLMTYGVSLGIAFSANLVTMYVFFEMLTLVTLPLVTHYQDRDSLYAGWKYMIYCIGGAALGFISVVMATLDGGGVFHWGGSLSEHFSPELMRIIFLVGFFGFGTKAAVFPLHDWLPTAGVAPTPVTALLHAVAVVNAGFFAVVRLGWYSFGPELLLGSTAQTVVVLVSAFSMVYGAVLAVKQRHFKRRLAYSTMSNLSYMLFGAVLFLPEGLMGGLAHMVFHSIIKMGLFLCAGSFMHVTGREYLYEINGMGRTMPFTFTCYTLGALSLTGIPLFCGFVSKWRLLLAGIHAGTVAGYIGVGALLLSALLCAVYSLTVSVRAFYPLGGAEEPGIRESGWRMLVPIGVFTVLNVVFGVWIDPILSFLTQIAEGMI